VRRAAFNSSVKTREGALPSAAPGAPLHRAGNPFPSRKRSAELQTCSVAAGLRGSGVKGGHARRMNERTSGVGRVALHNAHGAWSRIQEVYPIATSVGLLAYTRVRFFRQRKQSSFTYDNQENQINYLNNLATHIIKPT